jgi:hypothetical protein
MPDLNLGIVGNGTCIAIDQPIWGKQGARTSLLIGLPRYAAGQLHAGDPVDQRSKDKAAVRETVAPPAERIEMVPASLD